MPQFKIYGQRDSLQPIKTRLSDIIHNCAQEALGLPENKRFHRFIPLEPDDFIYPNNPEDPSGAHRSNQYLILEISMFEGRSIETKKQLLRLLMSRIHEQLEIALNDIEITIFETPKHNWGIRGVTGDELGLTYKVDV
jgi:phenylpyruvate tautomerase PptA (4-oxalocrotonate tautomerase family)